MTFGTSALQRENGRHAHLSAPAATIGSVVLHATPDPLSRVRPSHLPRTAPLVTWVGPMEVMMGGCRYRLVPADAPANHTGGAGSAGGTVEPLTPRETQIARLVADGLVNKEIATRLSISEWTVSTHMRRIFAKLGVETRAAMVLRCFGARQ